MRITNIQWSEEGTAHVGGYFYSAFQMATLHALVQLDNGVTILAVFPRGLTLQDGLKKCVLGAILQDYFTDRKPIRDGVVLLPGDAGDYVT